MKNEEEKRLVTTTEAAKILGISKTTLQQWVSRGKDKLPVQPKRIGRAVRWSLPELNKYIGA